MDININNLTPEEFGKLDAAYKQFKKQSRARRKDHANRLRKLSADVTMFVSVEKYQDVKKNPLAKELFK